MAGTRAPLEALPQVHRERCDRVTLRDQPRGLLTASNQHALAVEGAAVGLENLALWTENGGTSEIKSGGELIGKGVFYGPNANFSMSSPATGAPVDSQFVARRAWLNQGTLRVAPNPANSVMIPMGGDYGLIR